LRINLIHYVEKGENVMIFYLKKNILSQCVAACVLFWIVDAMLDSRYKTPHLALGESLFTDRPIHELCWRVLISILLISIGIIARQYFQYSDAEISIGRSQEHRWKFKDVKLFTSVTARGKTTSRHHIIISGTGRTGSTFLIQLLTTLKLDTGFCDPTSGIFPISNAGMETDIRHANAPYIVKSPWLCDTLDAFLQTNHAVIDHAIIPIRDLYSAAESRRDVFRRAGGAYPGGLWHTKSPEDMESVLTLQLYKLFFTLAKHNIPVTLLYFPRIVNEPEYLYNEIRFLFPNINYNKFLQCFQSISRPELVHVFR
jgi:hypothetical protein